MNAAPQKPPIAKPVAKLWPGSTVVCIGGGTSLTRDDVGYVQGKAKVIAIKEAMIMAPWADALYAADYKWWKYYKGAPEFAGLKFGIDQSYPPYIDYPDVHVLNNTGVTGLELQPTGLRIGNNSGYQAINLAVHLGAAKIILLGYDCWAGPNGQQNWFGDHPIHTRSPYPLFLQQFSTLIEPLKAAGVQVINCSRFTMLRAFPRMTLAEAFQC